MGARQARHLVVHRPHDGPVSHMQAQQHRLPTLHTAPVSRMPPLPVAPHALHTSLRCPVCPTQLCRAHSLRCLSFPCQRPTPAPPALCPPSCPRYPAIPAPIPPCPIHTHTCGPPAPHTLTRPRPLPPGCRQGRHPYPAMTSPTYRVTSPPSTLTWLPTLSQSVAAAGRTPADWRAPYIRVPTALGGPSSPRRSSGTGQAVATSSPGL